MIMILLAVAVCCRHQAIDDRKYCIVLTGELFLFHEERFFSPYKMFFVSKNLWQAIDENNYDVVLLQELFLFRLGPLANTRSFETVTRSMRALGYILAADPRKYV